MLGSIAEALAIVAGIVLLIYAGYYALCLIRHVPFNLMAPMPSLSIIVPIAVSVLSYALTDYSSAAQLSEMKTQSAEMQTQSDEMKTQSRILDETLATARGQQKFWAVHDPQWNIRIERISGELELPDTIKLEPFFQSPDDLSFTQGEPVSLDPARHVHRESGFSYILVPQAKEWICGAQSTPCGRSILGRVIIEFYLHGERHRVPVYQG